MTKKQMDFLVCLLENSNTTQAIKEAGISSATAYKWLKDPEFKKFFEWNKQEMLSAATRYLQGSLGICCEKLMEIVKDPKTSAQVKINAISLIFQNVRAFTEQTDILIRISELEQAMQEER